MNIEERILGLISQTAIDKREHTEAWKSSNRKVRRDIDALACDIRLRALNECLQIVKESK